MAQQPYLFDLVSCVNAPSLVLSAADGQVREGGVQGWLCGDRRFLSRMRVSVNGCEPVGLRGGSVGAARASFRGIVPEAGDPVPDPTVFVDRVRDVGHDHLVETLTVFSTGRRPTELVLTVEAAADFATMAEVRVGRPGTPSRPAAAAGDGELRWHSPHGCVVLRCDPPPDSVDADRGAVSWSAVLTPGESVTVRMHAEAAQQRATVFGGVADVPWHRPEVVCADRRLPRLLRQGLDDLGGLLLSDVSDGDGDAFTAAGSPWFLTLFGRDALWTARMLLPLGTDVAMSTLRVLARRQGTRHDPDTAEQPGRILHEVRSETLALEGLTLPPTYFGTADATPLFVVCLAEAWRWGADRSEVERLLPAMQRCLEWLEEQAADGFIRYVDPTGTGLSNQGWKDSEDSIQWADGSLATPPIALSEVQAYAFQAAMLGADLLDEHGLPGASRWRTWAHALAERFRRAFWVQDAGGPFPAIALDADGEAVDSVASNMAHLLGTGLLSTDEKASVARRLGAPDMDSGFGLRTLTANSPAFSRLSYHGGAVWPHDTAIAVMGLARDGFGDQATSLLRGLVRAAPHFDFRLPELYGGDGAHDVDAPMPYPAACRPQAWSAAAPVAALVALLGLHVDVPNGAVAARPVLTAPLLPMAVSGLRLGEHRLDVAVDDSGRTRVRTGHPGVSVAEEDT